MSNAPTPHNAAARARSQDAQAWGAVQNRLQAFLNLQSKSISNIKQVNMLQAQFNNEAEPITTLQPKMERAYHAALADTAEQEKHVAQSLEALNALMAHRNVQANAEASAPANPEKRQKKRRLDGQEGPGLPMSREGSRASPAPLHHSTGMSQSGSASGSGKRPPPPMSQLGRPNASASGSSGPTVPQTITVTTSMKPVNQQQKKLKRDGTPSAGPGAASSSSLAVGRIVAAKQPPEAGQGDDYIIVKVVKFHGSDVYTVQDVEAEEGKTPATFKSALKDIVILPDPADKSTFPAIDIPAGSPVMAVYPDTTSLYHGKVAGQPIGPKHKREEKDNVYRIIFDDDGNQLRPVPSHLVVKWKK